MLPALRFPQLLCVIVIVLALCPAFVFAQTPVTAETLVGTWVVRTPELEIAFTANADGTYTRQMRFGMQQGQDSGSWTLADGILQLQPDGGMPEALRCSITAGDELEVLDEDGNGFRLARQGGAPAQQAPPAAPAQPGEQPPVPPAAGQGGASGGRPALQNPADFRPPFPLPQAAGGHIIFTRHVNMPVTAGGLNEVVPIPKLFVMNADGSGQTGFLAPDDFTCVKEPRWSPGYDRLVFSSDWMQARSVCVQDIFIAQADGSGFFRVTGNELRGPAPRGYGMVTGLIRDNTRRSIDFQLEKSRLQINVAGQGGDGIIYHPGDAFDADILNKETQEKLREERMRRFFLPKIAAGDKTWVRIWSSRHMGHVVFAPIKPNTLNDLGAVELNIGNYYAANGNVTPDGRHVVGMGGILSVDPNAEVPFSQQGDMTMTQGGTAALCVYDGASGNLVYSWSTRVGISVKEPALSPDGTQVAVSYGEPTLEGLAVVGLADLIAGNANPRVLVPGERMFPSAATGFMAGSVSAGTPAWSPDGSTLAFCRGLFATQVVTGNLWLAGADGSGLRQLTNFGPDCLVIQPCFSPDGQRVAFTVLQGKQGPIKPEQFVTLQFTADIYTIGVDGSGLQRLTNDGVSAEPAWGP